MRNTEDLRLAPPNVYALLMTDDELQTKLLHATKYGAMRRLASQCGVHVNTIQSWRRGVRGLPDGEQRARLVEALLREDDYQPAGAKTLSQRVTDLEAALERLQAELARLPR